MTIAEDRQRCRHLLRRFGLGASEAELDFYLSDGTYRGAVERLLGNESIPEDVPLSPLTFRNERLQLNPQVASVWWTARMLTTTRPLVEKMTLFWHDHFATSGAKVSQGVMMVGQNLTLRQHALGNFGTLLHAVSKDPAMIFWLDGQENVAGRSNENFAREVMELFTLGIGNYSEKDVQEAARAFTGLSFRRNRPTTDDLGLPEFQFRPQYHDTTPKEVLGLKGDLDAEQVLDHLLAHPKTPEFLVSKLLRWFVMPEPDAGTVRKFARVFRENNLEIKPLLRAIMLSEEFLAPAQHRAVFKNPVEFVLATARQVGVGGLMTPSLKLEPLPRGRLEPVVAMQRSMRAMGMYLLFPPDVAGWKIGVNWISSATMTERLAWADRLFGVSTTGQRVRLPLAATLFAPGTSSDEAVDRLVAIFDAPTDAKTLAALRSAARSATGGTLRADALAQDAAAITKLIFSLPSFQMG